MRGNAKTLLNTIFDVEEVQRNVWYWRRVNHQQLPSDHLGSEAEAFPFSRDTVLKADRAFLATYRHLPEGLEWNTTYLLLLKNLEQDPAYCDSILAKAGDSGWRPQFAPRSVALQQSIIMKQGDGGGPMLAVLGGLLAVGVGTGAFFVQVEIPVELFVVGAVSVGLLGVNRPKVESIVFTCPECGYRHESGAVTHCQRCHLEYAGGSTTAVPTGQTTSLLFTNRNYNALANFAPSYSNWTPHR